MMASIRSLAEAEAEIFEAAAHYEAQRPGLGVEFLMAVDDGLSTVAASPLAFPRWRDDRGYRKYVLRRFPYVIFYSAPLPDHEVLVVAVAHAKQRPGYWLFRVENER